MYTLRCAVWAHSRRLLIALLGACALALPLDVASATVSHHPAHFKRMEHRPGRKVG